jgi:glycosyltransferase involved in cell wall biosynthesis
MNAGRVAIVLPPREAFSPHATGAIGLVVRRFALQPSAFRPLVLGAAVEAPFADPPFRPVRQAWVLGGPSRRYAAGALGLLRADPPDLVEVHNRPDVALYLARRLDRPVLLVLHNDPHGMRRARSAAERAALLDRVAGIAGVSEWVAGRLLEGVDAPARPVAVLPNCIDLATLPPPIAREPVILFAGRMVADKGADTFVTACGLALSELAGWRAEMIGADRFGPASPETPFLRGLRPRAAAAGVALRGWLPHEAVLAALARAAIAVVPSRWPEPFGLAALEAMACGAPLIASERGGLREVVAGASETVDPDDPAALAAAITALARDPARRAALERAGRARARQFDAPAAAERLDRLRGDVLAAWSAGRRRPI